ncbi:MAG: bifunctional (p)ppGpp synthetase/guanosine-3',5'-bis(diphosphate) 3'-pyrophosphohydrolase [Gammaproteobacteria bacterium]|nr:bifunctional (p)ppGpp synthetase/guanosine-3',5'-bis(diphosphate) 3'-pyrophosphohydrolase [Gammaproteobacteria bacterium]
MDNLVIKAKKYAIEVHQRIKHVRKYSNQPYRIHLEAVAELVSTVTDDPETIAAAWLHDTVEDTPATFEDIESVFGSTIADLVEELTDISRPGDGNRASRKAIDRQHLAKASSRAKTVKLSDLIDNCQDICKHDPRFARVYLEEMNALLTVLKDGNSKLYIKARAILNKSGETLGITLFDASPFNIPDSRFNSFPGLASPHFRRMFSEIFTARDVLEPILSFDAQNNCKLVSKAIDAHREKVATIRYQGAVRGYIRRDELDLDDCVSCMRHFKSDQVVTGNATLADVIHVLTRHEQCFVSLSGEVVGVIDRDDINKPIVRMWLFGMITMIEMGIKQIITQAFPDDSWEPYVTEGRLAKAKSIQQERLRRNQNCQLLECLQLSDKGQILLADKDVLEKLGFESTRIAKKSIKQLESLRNNLAHAQDIATHDWAQIARMTQQMEESLKSFSY